MDSHVFVWSGKQARKVRIACSDQRRPLRVGEGQVLQELFCWIVQPCCRVLFLQSRDRGLAFLEPSITHQPSRCFPSWSAGQPLLPIEQGSKPPR